MNRAELYTLTFFRTADGETDEAAAALNCFEVSVYNILKNSRQLSKEMVIPLFLRDINPVLWYNKETGIFRFHNRTRNVLPLWRKYVGLNRVETHGNADAIRVLENLLDQNKMVILQTVFNRLNFFIHYSPAFNMADYNDAEDQHANVIVSHDEKNLYYIEKNIRIDNFVPFQGNEQIGVVAKKDVLEALRYFMRCFTLEISFDQINNPELIESDMAAFMKCISGNYFGAVESVEGYTRWYGAAALEKLAEFCETGVDINKYFVSDGWLLQNRVCFDIEQFYGARLLLLEHCKTMSGDFQAYRQLLQKSITKWKTLCNIFLRHIYTGGSRLSPRIAVTVRVLIDIENQLNSQMLKLFVDNIP